MSRGFFFQFGSLLVGLTMIGCASTPTLSIDEIMTQYEQIAELEQGVKAAEGHGAEVLAPEGFASVSGQLDKAIAAARDEEAEEANSLAKGGLKALEKVNADVAQSADLMREVLEVRERADDAGAWDIYPDRAAKLEKSLAEAGTMIERGKLDDAKKRRQELIDGYAALELDALKEGMVEAAQASIANAKDAGAKKYAPKTFKAAEDEMALVSSILDADRTDTDRANEHARRAKYLANQSASITELIKDMDRRKYSREDTVLWYQKLLAEIYEPLGEPLPFDDRNRDVVAEMREAYVALIAQRDELAALKQSQQQEYQQQLELTEEQLAERKRLEEEERKRFGTVQSMFTPAEATVYRQRENVLISAHGFTFPSGQSEINSDNFVLLNKVVKAIGLFPGSTVQVSGHTDSTGSSELNQKISEQRAANVAKFLIEVGGISADRLSSAGYGKERPVQSNETPEGRAANRRVEILIVNK